MKLILNLIKVGKPSIFKIRLPGSEDLIEDILSQIPIPINSGILENPKFALVRTFNELSREDDTSFLENHVAPYPNTPFFTKDVSFTKINDYDLLLKQENNFNIGQLPPPDQNYNLHNLKKIIHKLRTNNIDMILFTTPHAQIWLEEQPMSKINNFNFILDDISLSFDVEIHYLHDQYSERTDIWYNFDHIAVVPTNTFYYDDIVKIILSEIDS